VITSLNSQDSSQQSSMKNNLQEYFSDSLKIKLDNSNNFNLNDLKVNMNEIIQSIVSRMNMSIVVNQQIKHVFQWVIDISLYLTTLGTIFCTNTNDSAMSSSSDVFGASLLNDLWFLNELRKALLYIKLLYVYNTQMTANANTNNTSLTNKNSSILSSLPILPLKVSNQRDLLSDLFNLFTKIILKTVEGIVK
jgi:hypothetical protein